MIEPKPTINLRRPLKENTTSWVDEQYSLRLVRQAIAALMPKAGSGEHLLSLTAIRKSPLYICEKPAKVGWGFKRGTRVFHLDVFRNLSGIGIYTVDYDRRGVVVERSINTPPKYVITRHALGRLFQRLRTNSFDVVLLNALAPIANLEDPEYPGLGAEIVIPGIGVFHAASDMTATSGGHRRITWVLKTFVAEEV